MIKKASFITTKHNHRLDVVFSGTFTLEDAKAYETAIQKYEQTLSGRWYVVADASNLQPSTLEAIEYVEKVTHLLFQLGCDCIITIAPSDDAMLGFQVKKAAGSHNVHLVDSKAAANDLIASLELPDE